MNVRVNPLALVVVALVFGYAAAPNVASAQEPEQEAATASLYVELEIPVEEGATLRITAPTGETCTELPLAAGRTSYTLDVAPDTCRLAEGDTLTFWLIHPNGGLELLADLSDAPTQWSPGATLTARVGKVPCPEPCRPPDPAGPADPELSGFPNTGTGDGDGASWWWTSAFLIVPAALVVIFGMRRRRDRGIES